jgi:hypothetical protein
MRITENLLVLLIVFFYFFFSKKKVLKVENNVTDLLDYIIGSFSRIYFSW